MKKLLLFLPLILGAQQPITNTSYGSVPYTASITAGDMACAHAADTTINQLTVSAATKAAPIVFTVTASPITAGYYVGLPITASASNPSLYDSTTFHVVSLDATHITVDNVGAPASDWTSGTKLSMTCGNTTTDALSASPYSFLNTYNIPANTFTSGVVYNLDAQVSMYSSATAPGIGRLDLLYGSTQIYAPTSTLTPSAGATNYQGMIGFELVASSATVVYTQLKHTTFPATNTLPSWNNVTKQPLTLVTSSLLTLNLRTSWAATGIGPAVCNDAGNKCGITTVTGTAGQTCTLASFNGTGGSLATATVTLTGTNAIANGTAIVITNTGIAFTAVSTAATAGSGTATCSGTAALTMAALAGAQGNAISILNLVGRSN